MIGNHKHKNKATRGAFTLIEILVVLVIMGFLVALVAPKLSGIVDSAVDVSCDTNQERLRTVVNVFANENRALPNGMVSLVVTNDAYDKAAVPSADDRNKQNGREFLSAEFVDRMLPQVHFLNQDEADQLREMGLNQVRLLGKTDDAAGSAVSATKNKPDAPGLIESNVMRPVAPGLPVLMAGFGVDDGGAATWSEGNTITVDGSAVTETNTKISIADTTLATSAQAQTGTFARMDEGKAVGRILMGVNEANELVAKGLLDSAGLCPGAIQNKDFHSYGNYVMVLPRLEATIERMLEEHPANTNNDKDKLKLNVIGLKVDTGENATGNTIENRSGANGCKNGFAAGKVTDVTTACPEGHTWGSTNDAYAISINAID